MPGVFITFEGGEAAGKSTQMGRLQQRLEGLRRSVLGLHDPGSTDLGEAIRELLLHSRQSSAMRPETELLLFSASRAQLVAEVIAPALAIGHDVLCDRFTDSTVAYQGYGRGLDREMIENLAAFCTQGLRPHLTIVLDLDLATARRRRLRQVRPLGLRDRMESQPPDFFERVRAGFLALADSEENRVKVIDGSAPVEQVEQAVWREVHGLFK